MAQQFNYEWTDSSQIAELHRNITPPNKKNEVLTGCFIMPIPSNSEFFGLEGLLMRWTSLSASLLVMSSEYESII